MLSAWCNVQIGISGSRLWCMTNKSRAVEYPEQLLSV